MASNYHLFLLIFVFAGAFLESNCKLTQNFYKSKCPKALSSARSYSSHKKRDARRSFLAPSAFLGLLRKWL
ncbi:hypothetical protein ACFX13_001624 [Malus domestica]